MTWPKRYGGRERSALERYVILEEMLFAGAPVSFHWIAERQSGPQLALRHRAATLCHPAGHRARRVMFLHRVERAQRWIRRRKYPHSRLRGGGRGRERSRRLVRAVVAGSGARLARSRSRLRRQRSAAGDHALGRLCERSPPVQPSDQQASGNPTEPRCAGGRSRSSRSCCRGSVSWLPISTTPSFSSPPQRFVPVRPFRRRWESRIRCMAPSASRWNTLCIGRRAGSRRGGPNMAVTATGRCSWAGAFSMPNRRNFGN